jgi:signal transduction histidine kinase
MRERVEALGGTLHAGPVAGAGWAVRASLPVAARGQP